MSFEADRDCEQPLALGPHRRPVHLPPHHKPNRRARIQARPAPRLPSKPRLAAPRNRLRVGHPPTTETQQQQTHTPQSGRNLIEIDFTGPNTLKIGRFQALDYFHDGSFYLLDSPGHAIGHLCGLARTTLNPDTFILLGGDVCHYAGIFRPSVHLPMPEAITPHPCNPSVTGPPMCPGHAWEELQRSRGRKATDTLYDMTYGLDIPLATQTMGKLQELDCLENVLVVIAHDATVRDGARHFPESLNAWKAEGLGERVRWAFLGDLEVYWKAKGLCE